MGGSGRVHAVRVACLIIGTFLWIVYSWANATPTRLDRFGAVKGWDFAQFYVNGRLIAEGRSAELFDPARVSAATADYVSDAVPYVHNVYGPHVSLLFVPLGVLSYGWALATWVLASTVLYAWSCASLIARRRDTTFDRATLALVVAASPAWWLTVSYGQLSAALLTVVCAAMTLHAQGRRFASGVVLGLLLAKPQLLLPAAAVLVVAGEFQIIAGVALSATLQCTATAVLLGPGPLLEYGRVLLSLRELAPTLQAKSHLLQSFTAFWGQLLPGAPAAAGVAVALCSLAALAIGARSWRRASTVDERWASVLCVMVLVSPHLYVYDLLLMTPVMLVMLEGGTATHDVRPASQSVPGGVWLAALLYTAPLFGVAVARVWSIQPTTVIVAAILLAQARTRPEPSAS